MAATTLRFGVKIKELPRKLLRLRSEIAQRVKRSPARMAEALSSVWYFVRTGKIKMQDDVFRYANETGVVADIHPDDLIFRFVMKSSGFKTNEEAIKYYFYDGANSARKLSNLLFSELGLKRTVDTSLLEFASGYGCVTRHLASHLAPLNIVSCDIHEAACIFIDGVIGVKTILSATKPEDLFHFYNNSVIITLSNKPMR